MTDAEKRPDDAARDDASPHDNAEASSSQRAEHPQIDVQIKEILQGKHILLEDAEGKEVSQVYIQRGARTTIYNIYESRTERTVSAAETPSRPPAAQRVGDLTLNPLPQAAMDQVNATYVPMVDHERALRRLREHRLIFLYGEPGSGKRTAAIRLLIEYFDADIVHNAICELNPALKLSELNVEDIPDRTGLFLESSDGSAWQDLNQFQLNALLTRFQNPNKTNALIIISHQRPAHLPPENHELIQPWRLQWPAPVRETQTQVLLRHFKFISYTRTDIDPALASDFERLLQDDQLQTLLQNTLRPAQLADLTHLLLQTLLGQITLEEALSQFHERDEAAVASWFAQGHDPDLETLLIATAVFNGLPYSFIREASQELLHILRPESPEQHEQQQDRPGQRAPAPTPAPSLFATRLPVDERLKRIHAHQEIVTRRAHFGEIQEKVVQLDNPNWQPAVLRFLWQIDGMQAPLLAWLTPYGTHAHHAIRTRAAAAIGALALEDFGYIEANVLRDWAASLQPNARRSAAQALGMTIWDDRHSGPSAGLLHYWATQKDNWRWQWTAASAYAGLAGLRYPQQTLNDLRVIAQSAVDAPSLLEPFLIAIINLYGEGKGAPEQRLALLQSLFEWSELPADRGRRQETFSLRRTALLGFLYLLMPDRYDPVWRLALQDVGESDIFRDMACQLLHRSLNFRQPAHTTFDGLHPRKMALDLLNRLIVFIGKENDPDMYRHLRTLLYAYRQSIAQSPHDLQRIHHKATHWEDAKEVAPELVNILI